MRHDTQFSEACRLARYAVKCRAAGDELTAQRYERRALELVGQVHERQVTEWRQRGRRAMAAALAGLALWAMPATAEAAGPRKPVVCMAYELVQAKSGAICYDGKRPKYLVVVGEMVIKDPEAPAPVRVIVGFP